MGVGRCPVKSGVFPPSYPQNLFRSWPTWQIQNYNTQNKYNPLSERL